MKRIMLVLVFVAMLSLTGCIPSTNILDAEFTIMGWEQDVYCGGEIYKAINGEEGYSWSRSACPACPACPGGPGCPACPACPACPGGPGGPECPSCPCCNLEWGNYVYIEYKVENVGNVDIKDYEVCFIVTFKDGTKCEGCTTHGYPILTSEKLFEQAKISIQNKRVILVEANTYKLQ